MKKLFLFIAISLLFLSCTSDNNEELTLPEKLDFKGEVLGCADFSVKKFLNSEDFKISLNIGGSGREDLNLSSEYKSFALPNDDVYCNITIYDASVRGRFCNDVVFDDGPNLISKWDAISGSVKLSVSDIDEDEYETYYRLKILLENVVFEKTIARNREQQFLI